MGLQVTPWAWFLVILHCSVCPVIHIIHIMEPKEDDHPGDLEPLLLSRSFASHVRGWPRRRLRMPPRRKDRQVVQGHPRKHQKTMSCCDFQCVLFKRLTRPVWTDVGLSCRRRLWMANCATSWFYPRYCSLAKRSLLFPAWGRTISI